MRPVRIANFSGFLGDRATALAEMAETAEADVLTGDYLAEVTMRVLAKGRARDPEGGYAEAFVHHLRPAMGTIAASGIRVVVNAGGLNPHGLATRLRKVAAEAGVQLNIATVAGDDISTHWSDLLGDLDFEPATANAYLGGWGIAEALRRGAQVVVTGRVADASLAAGAAAWWHNWSRDNWNALAGAVVAGHVIECGTQATGGNTKLDPAPDGRLLGFPIAEIAADGTSLITKPAGTGGTVDHDAVTAQLVYEIQGRYYANPDVTTDLTTIALTRQGPDSIRVSGAAGHAPPPDTKVALTADGDWVNTMYLAVTGTGFEAKRVQLDTALRAFLTPVTGIDELGVELIGTEADDPATQNQATGLLRVTARGSDEAAVGRVFSNGVVQLGLANYPGLYLTAPPGKATRAGRYHAAFVAQNRLDHVATLEGGETIAITPPPVTAPYVEAFDAAPPPASTGGAGDTVTCRLGDIALGRSGDKGANANVGIWVDTGARWDWLHGWLTTDRFRGLLPEAAGCEVRRLSLPNLRALNFVVTGLMPGGAAGARRFDTQAKGLSEFLRARVIEVPRDLLDND
ncbi:acyclic terpene utilization AtuA family protein [Streptomyces sp. NPDC048629]|uniref:acyclic terpene utilization AtuA family protein n=1 Tax=Streptomyces sp. NPDC048629 TaxID=3154824 RepID=UPI0034239A96